MMAVTVQGYLALDLVKKNNVERVKGVDRASTTTGSALRTAVTVGAAFGLYATWLLVVRGVPFDPVNFVIYLPVSLCYILSMIVGYFGLRYLALSVASPVQNTSGAAAAVP